MTTQHLEKQITESPPDDELVLSDDEHRLYTAAEFAKFLRMSRGWVLKQVREGRVGYIEVGNKYMFLPRHVREAIAEREVDPAKRGRDTTASAAA